MPTQVQLFGGAITAAYPDNLTDASDLRQVPDTQEVFLSNDSDLSLILEVLELVRDEGAQDDLDSAIRFHFKSLAHDTEALSSSVDSISLPTPSPPAPSSTTPPLLGPTTLIGHQTISKFNKPAAEADEVLILLALWRLPTRNADLVLTVNYPVRIGETGPTSDDAIARRAFEEAVSTLEIRDFGLFAGGE